MKFTYALTAAFAGSALAAPAPILDNLPTSEVTDKLPVSGLTDKLPVSGITDLADLKAPGVKQEVLADLAGPVTAVVGGLGLAGAVPGLDQVTGLTSDVGGLLPGITGRDLPTELPEVPGLSPEMVKQTVTGATVVFQKLNIKDIQNLQATKQVEVPGMDAKVVEKVAGGLTGVLGKLGLQQHVQQLLSSAPDGLPTDSLPTGAIPTKFSDLEGGLPTGLLAAIAPGLVEILTPLGLGALGPGLISLLTVLSEGI